MATRAERGQLNAAEPAKRLTVLMELGLVEVAGAAMVWKQMARQEMMGSTALGRMGL